MLKALADGETNPAAVAEGAAAGQQQIEHVDENG
jgi:hypothetical protein